MPANAESATPGIGDSSSSSGMICFYSHSPCVIFVNHGSHDGEFVINAPVPTQDQTVQARMNLHEDPQLKSHIRVRVKINYLDEVQAPEEPQERVDIMLTHITMNKHKPPKADDSSRTYESRYIPTYTITDISNTVWKSALKTLFPHISEQKKDKYFDGLYSSLEEGHSLYFLKFSHRDNPFCINLVTLREQFSTIHTDLGILMKQSPDI